MSEFLIRPVRVKDSEAWLRLRDLLWPDERSHHVGEIASFFAGTLEEPEEVLLAENQATGAVMGMAELSLRRDVAGLEGQLTGYVEGMYVEEAARWRSVAVGLLAEARAWAQSKGCAAFASDREDRVIVDRAFGRL